MRWILVIIAALIAGRLALNAFGVYGDNIKKDSMLQQARQQVKQAGSGEDGQQQYGSDSDSDEESEKKAVIPAAESKPAVAAVATPPPPAPTPIPTPMQTAAPTPAPILEVFTRDEGEQKKESSSEERSDEKSRQHTIVPLTVPVLQTPKTPAPVVARPQPSSKVVQAESQKPRRLLEKELDELNKAEILKLKGEQP
ncbi:hypothetical protein HYW94_00435 [Candidatus Uhrbacteria bacterium]|nr:hypothetical protein [Candidatus Uhrbacteria bacterium]